MNAELCAQPGRSSAWHSWANIILQAAAVVAAIQHIAHAWDATSNGVTLATRGRNCAGNATDHDMHSTIVVSFSQDVGDLEAMANLSDDIASLSHLLTMSHQPCYRAAFTAPATYSSVSMLLVLRAYM